MPKSPCGSKGFSKSMDCCHDIRTVPYAYKTLAFVWDGKPVPYIWEYYSIAVTKTQQRLLLEEKLAKISDF